MYGKEICDSCPRRHRGKTTEGAYVEIANNPFVRDLITGVFPHMKSQVNILDGDSDKIATLRIPNSLLADGALLNEAIKDCRDVTGKKVRCGTEIIMARIAKEAFDAQQAST